MCLKLGKCQAKNTGCETYVEQPFIFILVKKEYDKDGRSIIRDFVTVRQCCHMWAGLMTSFNKPVAIAAFILAIALNIFKSHVIA
jgi:hypothetical protein